MLIETCLLILRESPLQRPDALERTQSDVQQETNDADQHHAGHYEVITVSGIASVDNQKAEPRINRDHFRRHYNQPRDPQRDAHPDNQLWHHGGIENTVDDLSVRQTEISPYV